MHPARFRPHERIADPGVFRRAFERKKSSSDGFLIVYGLENSLEFPRLGISASKRRIRRAADRNRVKRLLREAFRLNKADLPEGVDLIVVPRGPTLTFEQACRSLPNLARAVARRLSIPIAKSSP
jgi:ribonuclease P protein component